MTDDKAALGGVAPGYVIFAHGKVRKRFPTIDECMNWCLGLTSGLPWSEQTIGEIKELLATHGFYVTQRALSDTRYLIMPAHSAALLPAQRGEGGVDDVEQRFTDYAREVGYDLDRAVLGEYCSVATRIAWRAWQAAIAALPRSTEGWVSVPRAALESFLKTADALDNIGCAGLERVSFPVQDVRALRDAITAAPAAGAEQGWRAAWRNGYEFGLVMARLNVGPLGPEAAKAINDLLAKRHEVEPTLPPYPVTLSSRQPI